MNKYIPQPTDTSDITLTDDMLQLQELLAEEIHEAWAAKRHADGWKYGKQRNDALKTHPCMVPYQHLPEEEKDYDRLTVAQTLKLILKKGYKITK